MRESRYEHSQTRYESQPTTVYGDHQNGNRCFWKILFAIILTAAITFALTAGAAYMIYLRQLNPPATESQHAPAKGTLLSAKSASDVGLQFSDDPETVAALQKLVDVYNILKDNYYEDLSEAEMLEKMAEGLANTMGSKFTFYLTKEANEQIEQSMSGEYTGIGAVVSEDDGHVFRITDLIEGAPAVEAGLLIGDIIETVDGKPANEFENITHLASVIRGEEGSEVVLGIYRSSDSSQFEVTLARRKILTANTRSRMITDEIGYVQVTEFSHNVSVNFIDAVNNLVKKGAKRLVFDLRNNGGGLADETVKMVDYLTDDQIVASIKGRREGQDFSHEWRSDAKVGVPDDMSYVILVNRNSASSSELFSGALRDYGKATLVGEQTYGKGVGTLTYVLKDGSAVQVTNFEYFLPNGTSIQGIGLTPDFEVALPDDTAGLPISMLEPENDTQLQKAIEILEESLNNE